LRRGSRRSHFAGPARGREEDTMGKAELEAILEARGIKVLPPREGRVTILVFAPKTIAAIKEQVKSGSRNGRAASAARAGTAEGKQRTDPRADTTVKDEADGLGNS
jgi:hypothetical protein